MMSTLFSWIVIVVVMINEQFFSYIMAGTSYILTRQFNTLSFIFIMLTHENNSPLVDMSFY